MKQIKARCPQVWIGFLLCAFGIVLPSHSQTVDTFNPGGGTVCRLALQGDGKIIVGGRFQSLAGQSRTNIGRLNPDGTLDSTFTAYARGNTTNFGYNGYANPDPEVNSLVLQKDGKILLGGYFTNLCGQRINNLGRISPNGTVDATFTPNPVGAPIPFGLYDPPPPPVQALAVQADGKILVGGTFVTLGGQSISNIARLNTNGTPDTNFTARANASVYSIVLQNDGKILVGGAFTNLCGQRLSGLGRLNADGTLDSGFSPSGVGAPLMAGIRAIAIQPDGKILVGGCSLLIRLLPSGAADETFTTTRFGVIPPIDLNATVRSIALQADGKVLIGGSFTNVNGTIQRCLARLHPDGTRDTTFTAQTSGSTGVSWMSYVNALAIQGDGKMLVGGYFTNLAGATRHNIGRLNSTGAATQSLVCSNGAITWVQEGCSPEFSRTTFESASGTNWVSLGVGMKVPEGWTVGGFTSAFAGPIRARGFFAADGLGSWYVENTLAHLPPFILTEPSSRTNTFNTQATFSVVAAGEAPLFYQWLKNGTILTNVGGRIVGVQTSTLTINSVQSSDVGSYSVIITNNYGSATSAVATLEYQDPMITKQPASVSTNAGQYVVLSVTANGTSPISYQWRKDSSPLAGKTTGSLSWSYVKKADAGCYDVIVTNAFGCVTSSVASLSVVDPVILQQPYDCGAEIGTVSFSAMVAGTSPFKYQWRRNGQAMAGATSSLLSFTISGPSNYGAYELTVSNSVGSVTSRTAYLTHIVGHDSFGTNAISLYEKPYAVAEQGDGKLLVAGMFTKLAGQNCTCLGRLNTNGTLDTTFMPSPDSAVFSLALQPDGKVVIGGAFRALGGRSRDRLARLNCDGTVDTSFPATANGYVQHLMLQPDGKILAAGSFTVLAGQNQSYLGRLHPDGGFDATFTPNASSNINCLALQADGKVLVGGGFSNFGGQPRSFIVRLNSDGTLDNGFVPTLNGEVRAMAVQPDGKIVIGGGFTTIQGIYPRNYLARLNSDGTLETAFDPSPNGGVTALLLQGDGKLLVGGQFTLLNGLDRKCLGRLTSAGLADYSFIASADSAVLLLAQQADGKIVAGGNFMILAGRASYHFGRLNNTLPGYQQLVMEGSALRWIRGWTAPACSGVRFSATTNGTDWISLGAGRPCSEGWELDGVDLPTNTTFRATGTVTASGDYNSAWSVESSLGPLVFCTQPTSRTNSAGSTAVFMGQAAGTMPLSYYWLKNGVVVTNNTHTFGAQTATLCLTNVLNRDVGEYCLVASNVSGCVTSQVAQLSVTDPWIRNQPVSQLVVPGQVVTISATVRGTEPISYQWRKDGFLLSGANSSSLVFAPVQGSDAGYYDVVVSNSFGCQTSTVAMLTVNLASIDLFNFSTSLNVEALAVQLDGDILLGGSFTAYGNRRWIARCLPNGSLDTGFSPSVSSWLGSIVVQPDQKIVLSGQGAIARFDQDGTLDPTLNLSIEGAVNSLLVQPDGKMLIGGVFSTLCQNVRSNLCRLNSDGSVDPAFTAGADGPVKTMALQEDGKVLVGGSFTNLAGNSRAFLGRLNSDGSFDSAFNPAISNAVNVVAIQPDAKILVGGDFNGRIVRLNPDGTPDPAFKGDADNSIFAIALQANGKIVVGGFFSKVCGYSRYRIARLNADGTPDLNFGIELGALPGAVFGLCLEADGDILVGCDSGAKRIINTQPATTSLSCDQRSISWQREGTAPEILHSSFSYSTNGSDWISLGAGVRTGAGWQLTGLQMPRSALLRAQGATVQGRGNNSSSWLESTAVRLSDIPPTISKDEGSFGLHIGSDTVEFSFTILGEPGQVVLVESSNDLIHWIPLSTNFLATGVLHFSSSSATAFPQQFYRVR